MPKSGSTLLSKLVGLSPGFRKVKVVPGFGRREQELSELQLARMLVRTENRRKRWRKRRFNDRLRAWVRAPAPLPAWPIGFVCQNHLRFSAPTQEIINKFKLAPVVLVRDIFDVVPSIRDHYRNTSLNMPMAYVTEHISQMSDERLHEFIVDMVLPWYFNFFVSWQDCQHKLLVTYDDLIADQEGTLARVLEFAGLDRRYVSTAVKGVAGRAESKFTRKNVGKAGRGRELSERLKAKIRLMAEYYPGVDFDPIGL